MTLNKNKNTESWFFTFGFGQPHQNCYIKFTGTYEEARNKMVMAFDDKWCMQYSEADFDGQAERFNLKEIK